MNPLLSSSLVVSLAILVAHSLPQDSRADSQRSQSEIAADEKVSPGLVHWHTNPDAAMAAAGISGKPILVFQLLGELDERFC